VSLALILLLTAFCVSGATVAYGDESDPATIAAFSKTDVAGRVIAFSQSDFLSRLSPGAQLEGIVLTSLPDEGVGALTLGGRELLRGEAVPVEELDRLSFVPTGNNEASGEFTFLPVFAQGAGIIDVTVSLSLTKGGNRAPVAENLKIDTYRNIQAAVEIKATDPDGDRLTFKILSQPKKGEASLSEDGLSLVYTPANNKTGKFSFTYVAMDEYGNVSAPAEVSIVVSKPSTKVIYADMDGDPAYYAALRLAGENVFVGEQIGGQYFFNPEQSVSRGEFIVMAMKATGLADKLTDTQKTGFADDGDTPVWIKPYAVAALRAGIIRGAGAADGRKYLNADRTLTRAEAAVIINNAMGIANAGTSSVFADQEAVPAWAAQAVNNLEACGIISSFGDGSIRSSMSVTRAQAAQMLCQAMDIQNGRDKKGGLLSWVW